MRLFGETNTRPRPSRLTAAPPNRRCLNDDGPGNREAVGRYGRILIQPLSRYRKPYDVGFLDASDPRMVSTMKHLEAVLARGPHMLRYEAADDFGVPGTAFNTCSFWRIQALARMGRVEEAREHFEALLALRNRLGLMSEDVDLQTGELWGNYPQTYSLVGIINCAVRLSCSWEKAI